MENDLAAILAYFEKRQKQNPYFYYDVKVSPEGRVKNILWVNSKSRLSYDYFNDVVIFDSTNGLRKYNKHVTLTPFLGLNHHCQFIILGWALLLDQSEESFSWLFDSWLRAMHGKQPMTIITFPDLAVVNAIKLVFPKTHCRLSLSYMKRKFKDEIEKLNNEKLLKEFKRCVTNSDTVERFERDWEKMVKDYGLGEFEWANELYQTRESWVPAYNRTAFAAGLHSTHTWDSLSLFLESLWRIQDGRLHRLVIKCEKETMEQYRAERRADYRSQKKPELVLCSYLETYGAIIYTPTMFEMFQEALIASTRWIVKRVEKNGSVRKYEVISPFEMNQQSGYVVTLDVSTNMGSCECQWYEYMGMLCSHMLAVLHRNNVLEIPRHFIMERWKKDANMGIRFSLAVDPSDPNAPAMRKNMVYRCMNYCRCLAKQSDITEVIYHDHVDALIRNLGSIQIQYWGSDEDEDGDDDEDGEDSEYSDYSKGSEPIEEEDIEYIASIAERSGDVYKTIVKSVEELIEDLNNNEMHQHSEDYSYSEDKVGSDGSESVEGGFWDGGEFWDECDSAESSMQLDQSGESVEPDESGNLVESGSGKRRKPNSDKGGESSQS